MSIETLWQPNSDEADSGAMITAHCEERDHTVRIDALPDDCSFMNIVNPHHTLPGAPDEVMVFGAIISAEDALALGRFLVRYYGGGNA